MSVSQASRMLGQWSHLFPGSFPWFLPGCTAAQITEKTERPSMSCCSLSRVWLEGPSQNWKVIGWISTRAVCVSTNTPVSLWIFMNKKLTLSHTAQYSSAMFCKVFPLSPQSALPVSTPLSAFYFAFTIITFDSLQRMSLILLRSINNQSIWP